MRKQKYRDPGLNPKNLAVVYSVAGHEVRGWYRRVGQVGLLQLIANLREGNVFYRSYRSIPENAGKEQCTAATWEPCSFRWGNAL